MKTELQCRQDDDPSGEALILPKSIYDEVIAHLRQALPNEGCGLLGVKPNTGSTRIAERFYPGTNEDRSPTRYTMNLGDVVAAFRHMDEIGLTFGTIVHSHPATPPTPSPTDLREAYYPEALMMIVSFAAGEPIARAWKVTLSPTDRAMTEVPISLRPFD